MASTPCPTLEDYNSLLDPNLANYFSNPTIRRHLKKIGLINRRGELRTETEILQFNAEIKQKKQLNDLLSRAIILKAADLDRQRQHEMKKLQNEEEKRERVRKAREAKNKMDYTKTLSAKFYTDAEEEEDYVDSGKDEEEVKLTLPTAIPIPEGDQVYSMSKLMQQKKVMSPYIADGRPSTVGHHALPTLVHDRVQAKIYGAGGGSKFKRRPTSNSSRASYTLGPKKSVTISSINRLARSKLPGIEKPKNKKSKKQTKKMLNKAEEKPSTADSGRESLKADSIKNETREEIVRSSTPTKSERISSASKSKNKSKSSSSSSSSKSSSKSSTKQEIKEDIQVKIEEKSVEKVEIQVEKEESILSSSSEHEVEEEAEKLEIAAERSTAETKASAYSLPMTPLVQKKEKSSASASNSLSSSMSSLSSSSSEANSKSKASSKQLFASAN